uniref:Cytochrome c oxidase subunit 2 n=1 Tax=Cerophytidae sp. BMNH 900085 TaxID=1903808 RepID=A0A343A4I5_9COLE|nr:cytochrome c oxidase subunit 2 [Cerophytidae sp. BMNH 900085]
MATWLNINSPNSSSPIMEQLLFFHDYVLILIVMIIVMVMFFLMWMLMENYSYRKFLEEQYIETVWTIIPMISLIFIAFPSLQLLYLMDEINNSVMSIKVIGHQWYWSYEYSDFKNLEFDSYMQQLSNKYNFRLLDVDNTLCIPFNISTRMIITSSDVIHSWTIPSLGVKIDASPGRLNQISFMINQMGSFFGQCSEICGMNHSFMPINLESVSLFYFMGWIKTF